MCGITGIFNLKSDTPISRNEIAAGIDTLLHRGPNQGGVYLSPRKDCGLGIRRLSIIDVTGGNQPLHNEDNTIHLVYNGETYNHKPLRDQLETLGHQPHTHSDGEAILHGYESWGPEVMLQKLRGMCAFALWDENRQQLFLARDRFGIKPLYYAQHAGRLYFASEIKAILAQPDIPRQVDMNALEAMLTLGFVPGPATMFEGIYKLPAAHYLLAANGTTEIKKYWQLDYRVDSSLTELEAIDQFMALLRESVQLRLMSEVPLGALLSGGLDSSTLVALMQREMSRKVKTVAIGFHDPGYDESWLAHDIAQHVGTNHTPITFEGSDFDAYPTVMRHLEEPQCSATALPIYCLYRACQQAGLTVVLTGEGADELLGGYHWHKGDALARRLLTWPLRLRRALAASPLPMSDAARRVVSRGTLDIGERYQEWLEIPDGGYWPGVLSTDVRQVLREDEKNPLLSNWSDKIINLPNAPALNQMLWLETQTRLVDFINFEVDKMSMAHSIEARVPFLDHKLWEFCATLPANFKLHRHTDKYLLRRATIDLLPNGTRIRRKTGLAAPYAGWLQSDTLPEWAEAALSADSLRQANLFNPEMVQQLRVAHQAGRVNLGPLLMGILSTQIWFDCFMDGSKS